MDNKQTNNTRSILFETSIIFRKCLKIWVFFPIALLLFIVDMITKICATIYFDKGEHILNNIFLLQLTYNPGLNFGLFDKYLTLSIIFSIFFSLLIFILFLCTSRGLLMTSFIFIFIGGFSNVFSRVLDSGHRVIDFIIFTPLIMKNESKYAFNLADIYVSIGAILFLIHLLVVAIESIVFLFRKKEKKELIYKKSFLILKLKSEFEDQLIWPWIMAGYDFGWKEHRLRKKIIKDEYKLEVEKLKKEKVDVKSKK